MPSNEFNAKIRFLANKNGFALKNYSDKNLAIREREATRKGYTPEQFVKELLEEVSGRRNTPGNYGLSKCPVCESMSLIHEDGCEHCRNCGYSACG